MTEWIDASERVPDDDRLVVVLVTYRDRLLVMTTRYKAQDGGWEAIPGVCVHYWADLPEVPEGMKGYGEPI